MKPLSYYRASAAELEALDVPVLLSDFRAGVRAGAGEFRTATRDVGPIPALGVVLHDPEVNITPLAKSDRNPYENFIFVGRASTCDVILRDASVSKSHAVFERTADGWILRDNRSHNGTWVHERRLAPSERVPVESGIAIVFGAFPVYVIMPSDLRRILETMGPVHG